ncbi:MAG: hypothetical protein JXX14_11340 [Deltaproteobacteria bacterium]|nr:hypothetical protein [Deltaproteobacteria bacterium]
MMVPKTVLIGFALTVLVGLMGCESTETAASKSTDSNNAMAPFDTVDSEPANENASAYGCSSSASEGLSVGGLIPNIELQRCDGSAVALRELVCGKGTLTHILNFTATCPSCVGFLGLTGGEDMGSLTAQNR